MNIQSICNSVSFGSKYVIDANQKMQNKQYSEKRDYALGLIASQANNCDEVKDTFLKNVEKDPNAPLILTLDMDNRHDATVEETFNALGQKFDKIS